MPPVTSMGDVLRVLSRVRDTWPNQRLAADTAKIWAPQLQRFPLTVLRQVVDELSREREFMPGLAALIRACEKRSCDMPDSADVAWGIVQSLLAYPGHNTAFGKMPAWLQAVVRPMYADFQFNPDERAKRQKFNALFAKQLEARRAQLRTGNAQQPQLEAGRSEPRTRTGKPTSLADIVTEYRGAKGESL